MDIWIFLLYLSHSESYESYWVIWVIMSHTESWWVIWLIRVMWSSLVSMLPCSMVFRGEEEEEEGEGKTAFIDQRAVAAGKKWKGPRHFFKCDACTIALTMNCFHGPSLTSNSRWRAAATEWESKCKKPSRRQKGKRGGQAGRQAGHRKGRRDSSTSLVSNLVHPLCPGRSSLVRKEGILLPAASLRWPIWRLIVIRKGALDGASPCTRLDRPLWWEGAGWQYLSYTWLDGLPCNFIYCSNVTKGQTNEINLLSVDQPYFDY